MNCLFCDVLVAVRQLYVVKQNWHNSSWMIQYFFLFNNVFLLSYWIWYQSLHVALPIHPPLRCLLHQFGRLFCGGHSSPTDGYKYIALQDRKSVSSKHNQVLLFIARFQIEPPPPYLLNVCKFTLQFCSKWQIGQNRVASCLCLVILKK